MSKFTEHLVEKLRSDLNKLQSKVVNIQQENQATKDVLIKEAQRIGDDFLQLEKCVEWLSTRCRV